MYILYSKSLLDLLLSTVLLPINNSFSLKFSHISPSPLPPRSIQTFTSLHYKRHDYDLGVLGHCLGMPPANICLSRTLNNTVSSWSSCVYVVASAFLCSFLNLTSEIWGSQLHSIPTNLSHLLTYKGLQFRPPSWILSLQTSFIENSLLTFLTCPVLYNYTFTLIFLIPSCLLYKYSKRPLTSS